MATVKIESEGHSVEVTDPDKTAAQVAKVARDIWVQTRGSAPPRMSMGFGAQHMERGGTPGVKGDPVYQYGGPVEA